MSEKPEVPARDDEEQELYEHHRFTVDKGQELLRIDKFLMNRIEGASRTRLQYAAEANCLQVNGKPVKSSYKVKPGDEITVLYTQPPREIELIAQNIPIDIVYEDEDLVLVNKKAGMVVHPGYGNYTGTLVNALLYHFNTLPSPGGGEIRPGLVHRIDKNTSGLILIAKNEGSMAKLAKQFYDRQVEKIYWTLVWGDLKEDKGTIEGNIGRSLKDRKVFRVYPGGEHGKPAVTHWNVVERFGYVTMVQCEIETGRTHQIRVHMKHIGHNVFNDGEYGGDKILKGTTFTKYRQFVENCFSILGEGRQALHAKVLEFKHPRTKKKIRFEIDLPADMKAVAEKWRVYAQSRREE